MPVDQTGENILFVVENGHVEAHIQIQYEGDPARFAWVIPVSAIPEVSPGSDQLFQNLLDRTVPTFLTTPLQEGDCSSGSVGCWGDDSLARGDVAEGDGGFGIDNGGQDPGADVVAQGIAGAFEYAVLKGETVEEVTEWLDENDYQQDEEAAPLLAEYLDEGFLFVAVKLRAGAGIEEIHPLVLDYDGDEPCVPIRLTRIAADDDMGIRVFFLGDARWVPTNYAHVELNWARMDWANPAGSYPELVTLAVDEAPDGHGFVTEYAGAVPEGTELFVSNPVWDADAFFPLEPTQLRSELEAQELMFCTEGPEASACAFQHPLIQGLLDRYLPVPPGVAAGNFYSCVQCYEELIDQEAWSAAGFSADLREQIIEPGEHARELLRDHDVLTRMFTTLSPHEMTEDPLFHANPDLPEVISAHRATRVTNCEGNRPDYFVFEDGRVLFVGDDVSDLRETLPAAERIERMPMVGAPQVDEDNAEAIQATLREYNADYANDGCNCRSARLSWQGVLFLGSIFLLAYPRRRRR